jgi:serine/threonine protein kinase
MLVVCAFLSVFVFQIIFRDLKPSNCLWQEKEKRAVIIDFDVGSYFDAAGLHRSLVGTDGHLAPEMMHIKYAKRRGLPLPYKGYGLEVDVYAAGMVLAQLLFAVSENDVADLDNFDAKGDAFIARVLELSTLGQATLAHHLLVQMLHPEPAKRITVDKALAHPWLAQ